jgi:hypothetical protein
MHHFARTRISVAKPQRVRAARLRATLPTLHTQGLSRTPQTGLYANEG